MSRAVELAQGVTVGADSPLAVIAGPCVIEGRDHLFGVVERLVDITRRVGVSLIVKSSYDKANRTSMSSVRGPGLEEGAALLAEVRETFGVPVTTDVHETQQIATAAAQVDLLQIPAFLCRQTDLLLAAAKSGVPVNVKKGQFVAPWDIQPIVDKLEAGGCQSMLLTERGTCFGYNNLVSDFRSLPVMRRCGYPVVFDATHSVQLPGGTGTASGGQREFVPALVRAAVAVGCDALFMEVHPDPEHAPSDGPTMVPLEQCEAVLRQAVAVRAAVQSAPDVAFEQVAA